MHCCEPRPTEQPSYDQGMDSTEELLMALKDSLDSMIKSPMVWSPPAVITLLNYLHTSGGCWESSTTIGRQPPMRNGTCAAGYL